MISEILEEAGLDRQKARALRRQVLQGIVLMCQWQIDRIDRSDAESAPAERAGSRGAEARKARRVTVE
jgi:hypothetical protein